jgi:SAM-dependent methyltransferase
MTTLFALTLFLSGALLFLVQPMFARLVLPLAGGAPAVWNTVMVCYQLLLLGGYLYAHVTSQWLSWSRQLSLHCLLVVLALVMLPIALPAGSVPPAGGDPALWVMTVLLSSAGLPFFVVATTSPLVQVWLARSGASHAANPYVLYAASNAGSLLALLAFPLLVEPALSRQAQGWLWAALYGALALLVATCGVVARRAAPLAPAHHSVDDAAVGERITPGRRAWWVLLAFVPSSLLLSVTLHLSTDIAPVPLLWVVPLALYLLTFIAAFTRRGRLLRRVAIRALPLAIVPVMVAVLADQSKPIALIVALHLVSFTIIALAGHAALAKDAPPARDLTEFYLWLAVGGALGGVFNALLAPRLFASIAEYPLVLALAAFVIRSDPDDPEPRATQRSTASWLTPERMTDVVAPLSLVPLILICDVVTRKFGMDSATARRVVALGAPAMICYALAGRRVRFGLGVAALLAGSTVFERNRQLLVAERSFFGVSRVYVTGGGDYHALVHGSISHGAQSTDPARRREPLSYYTRSGPVGELVIPRQRAGVVRSVGVVGLGSGSLACYRQPGETWTFFEIDAAVVRIARDPRYFTFLRDCAPTAAIVLGDARLSLDAVPDRTYDLLLLDAYSADAIPVHLLTREALALYRRKLAPGGVIALHISNLYFNLAPVVAALAADAGMVMRLRDEVTLSAAESARGKSTSDWVVLAEREADLGTLLALPRWERVVPAATVWTDDFSSALSAMR